MPFLKAALTAVALCLAVPALAQDGVAVVDPYARFLPAAKAGAAFMVIENHAAEDDRLVGAASDIAEMTELHTHKAGADGMMQMMKIEGGIVIPAGQSAELNRGGDHVMFMGLTARPKDGDVITLKLMFEKSGEVTVEVPVDNKR